MITWVRIHGRKIGFLAREQPISWGDWHGMFFTFFNIFYSALIELHDDANLWSMQMDLHNFFFFANLENGRRSENIWLPFSEVNNIKKYGLFGRKKGVVVVVYLSCFALFFVRVRARISELFSSVWDLKQRTAVLISFLVNIRSCSKLYERFSRKKKGSMLSINKIIRGLESPKMSPKVQSWKGVFLSGKNRCEIKNCNILQKWEDRKNWQCVIKCGQWLFTVYWWH